MAEHTRQMDFHDALQTLGYIKKWHFISFTIIIAVNIVMSENLFATVFYQTIPNHRCLLPHENSTAKFDLSKEEWDKNYPENEHSKTNYTECQMYESGPGSTVIKCKDNAVVFDQSIYINSAVTYFNMVCSDKWLLSTADSSANFGFLLGGIGLGWASDRYIECQNICDLLIFRKKEISRYLEKSRESVLVRFKTNIFVEFGRKPVLCSSLILQFLSGWVIIFSPYYPLYIAGRLINGIADSGICFSSYVLALEMVYPKHRLYASTILHISNASGFMLTALYGYMLRRYRYFYGAIISPGIIFAFFWFVILESPRWQITSNRLDLAVKNVKRIAKWNNVDLTQTAADGNFDLLDWLHKQIETNERENTHALHHGNILHIFRYKRLLLRGLVLCFSWFSVAMTYYGLTYFNNYLKGNNFINFAIAGAVEITSYIMMLCTLNKFGRRKLHASLGIIAGAFLIATGFVPGDMGWLIITFYMIGKLAVCYAFSVAYIYTVEIFPTVIRNTALGMCSTTSSFGSVSAPFILLSVDYWRPAPTLIMGSLMLISGSMCLYLPETLNKNLPETLEEGEHFK